MFDANPSGSLEEEVWLRTCAGMLEAFSAVADGPVPVAALVQTAGMICDDAMIDELVARQYLRSTTDPQVVLPGPNLLALARRLSLRASPCDRGTVAAQKKPCAPGCAPPVRDAASTE